MMISDVTIKWFLEGYTEEANANADRQIAEGKAAAAAGKPLAEFMPLFWRIGWLNWKEESEAAS